ncbi:CaiB/BaiF CoA transferase family protein [Jiangella alba]|uniref:CoA:oxalate CoA-transferase n=1 Tax=Jiangella alba TaxID=561176 RepID=A0A1H5JZX6_9ACTN|nr:CoA transferase [Jiangella alba]SEE58113.1 CoA:oxalate CoA-transferase [Jiangella alba]
MTGPLHGLKVIEISVAMAGPFCGMVLGDLGADVVKIERADRGDDSRDWPPYFAGTMSHYFASANRSKRSLALDLKSGAGAGIAKQLIAGADIVIENYRLGALERAGLGYAAMAELNPRLVYCSISGFGRTGPRRHDPANDLFMQAFSGGMSITGEAGGAPAKMGISVADIGAGMFAAVGILAALSVRHETGRGQHVQTSLLEGQLSMLSYHLMSYFASGDAPRRHGSGTQFGVPYQAFPTADEWIVVAVFNDSMWRSCCAAIERPAWADDPRFSTVSARVAHRELLAAELTEIFATRPAAAWEEVMVKAGVACTLVNPIDKIVDHPQVRAGAMITQVDVPGIGPMPMADVPIDFSTTPGAIVLPPPRLGEHSRSILRGLGLGGDTVDALIAAGVVGTTTPARPPQPE